MVNGTWIRLKNSLGCELDSHFVKEGSDLTYEFMDWLSTGQIDLSQGDTITFEAGESEED